MKLTPLLLALLITTPIALGLGVSPAGKTYEYDAQTTSEFTLTVLNNDRRDMSLNLYPQGAFSENVNVEPSHIDFSPDEDQRTVDVEIRHPEGLQPGSKQIKIIVMEIPGMSRTRQGNLVSATSSVAVPINIEVPYPGKYIEGALKFTTSSAERDTAIAVNLANYGSETIQSVNADIEVRGPTNEVIYDTTTNTISLDPRSQGKLVASWPGTKNPGTYYARAVVEYDGEKRILETTETLGNKKLELRDLAVNDYAYQGVTRLSLTTYNPWNEPVENAEVRMDVLRGDAVVDTVRSPRFSVSPYDETQTDLFWDLQNRDAGEYDLQFTYVYGEESNTVTATITITPSELVIGGDLTGRVTSEDSDTNTLQLIIILLIVLIIANVALFLYVKHRNTPPKN